MSNGYHIAAKAEAESGYIAVRECWGNYAPDHQRTIEVTDGKSSLFITPDQLQALVAQLSETREELSA